MAKGGRKKRRTGAQKRSRALRWAALASFVLIGALYYSPVRTYLETRSELQARAAEVRELTRQRDRLEQRLVSSADAETLLRDARKLGWVKPGERLVIVKNVGAWRRAQAKPQP